MTKKDTRSRILEQGARIIHQKGFNNTGIQEVLQAAGVPKGSFYFYFKSKEEFGLDLIDHFEGLMQGRMRYHFDSADSAGLKSLKAFFDEFMVYFEREHFTCGCPIGNLAQELGDLNPRFQERLKRAFDNMKTGITRCLRTARNLDEIDPSLDPEETADFIVNSWEGALLRMKAEKNLQALELFDKMIFGRILAR